MYFDDFYFIPYGAYYRQLPPPGVPPFGPFFPPSPQPPMGGGMGQPGPSGPPPSFTPKKSQAEIGVKAIDPGAIRGCLYKFTYVWLENGRSFWFWPVFVGRRSVSGFRWNGRFWAYFGIDLRNIDSFICY